MMKYEFEMSFKLPRPDADPNDFVDRLYEEGCGDATLGIGARGSIALDVTREASSAQQAIISVIEDVMRAIPGAELIEVRPDRVGLSDIAELVGVSRQNMRKLMVNHADTFPTPIHAGTTALWRAVSVLEWLSARGGYSIEQRLLDVSRVAMQINLAKELGQLKQPIDKRIRSLVA